MAYTGKEAARLPRDVYDKVTVDAKDTAVTDNLTNYVNNKPSGFKNLIINGGFDVWQRGTSFSNVVSKYTADRFLCNNASYTKSTLADGYTNALWVSNVTAAYAYIGTQFIENGRNLVAGKTMTLSFYWEPISNTNEAFVQFNYGTAVPLAAFGIPNPTVAGMKQITYTFPQNGTSGDDLRVLIHVNKTTIQGEAKIAKLQLEEGSVATPFEQRPYGLELSLCQRYYESLALNHPQIIVYTPNGDTRNSFSFNTTKRITPTCTTSVNTFNGIWLGTNAEVVNISYPMNTPFSNVSTVSLNMLGAAPTEIANCGSVVTGAAQSNITVLADAEIY